MKEKLNEQETEIYSLLFEQHIHTKVETVREVIKAVNEGGWIPVTDDTPDIKFCRVAIAGHEQESFYRHLGGVWSISGDNGLFRPSAFIPSFYYVSPSPPNG